MHGARSAGEGGVGKVRVEERGIVHSDAIEGRLDQVAPVERRAVEDRRGRKEDALEVEESERAVRQIGAAQRCFRHRAALKHDATRVGAVKDDVPRLLDGPQRRASQRRPLKPRAGQRARHMPARQRGYCQRGVRQIRAREHEPYWGAVLPSRLLRVGSPPAPSRARNPLQGRGLKMLPQKMLPAQWPTTRVRAVDASWTCPGAHARRKRQPSGE